MAGGAANTLVAALVLVGCTALAVKIATAGRDGRRRRRDGGGGSSGDSGFIGGDGDGGADSCGFGDGGGDCSGGGDGGGGD